MAYYWVNLGDSFEEVKKFNFLWAPSHTFTSGGAKTVSAGWKHVPHVKKDDVIICHEDKHVIYIAQATSDAYSSPRPENRTFDKWKKDGFKIDVKLIVLDIPVNNAEFKYDVLERFNEQCSPKLFGSNAQATQSYLVSIPDAVAAIILGCVGNEAAEITSPTSNSKSNRRPKKADIERERQAIVKSRIGQGQFRKDVLDLWNHTCPITQVNMPELLIASHILSWQLSNNEEKVDEYNGFPLAPNVDKLFDKGLISFTDDGDLLVSPSLDIDILNSMGISSQAKIEGLYPEHAHYLKRHREVFGFE
ncbi:hypothetical protein A9266_20010 [Vibrio tasmaniensis]|nr:hypothetical protein A9266_20010 [Vibrio tasmaniensis]